MSNRVTIEPTEFVNVRTGEVSYGFRAYDDYEQTYDNTLESIPDNDMEFLALICKEKAFNTAFSEMLDFVKEGQMGLYIGGTWYEWDAIEPILCKEEE